MLKCRDLVAEADLLLAGELSWQRRLAIRIHLLMCRHCRRFMRQFKLLLSAIPAMHKPASEAEVEQVMQHIQQQRGPDLH